MDKLEKLMSKTFDITVSEAKKAEYLTTHRWDSLGHVNLILTLEEGFNISISEADIVKLTSYNRILKYINSKTSTSIFSNENNDKDEIKIHRGLNGVYFDKTNICLIDQQNNSLYYRDYSINDIIHSDALSEEVIHLLIYGKLPNKKELGELKRILQKGKMLVFAKQNQLQLRKNLKLDLRKFIQSSIYTISELVENNIEYLTIIPVLIYLYNSSQKKPFYDQYEIINTSLHTDLVLKCLNPNKVYSQKEYLAYQKLFITHLEHGANASTFACRVTASTEADFVDALTSAIATFSGNLHGGAIIKVIEMIDELSNGENILENVLKKRIANAVPIYGFGHRVYKNHDPRALIIDKIWNELITDKYQLSSYFKIAKRISFFLEKYSSKGLGVNVDFYSALLLKTLDLSKEMFLASFISSRVVGWLAHYNEQRANNVLIRPRLFYTGDIK